MTVYVIPDGDDPELHMDAAQAAGCDSIQVGFPEGVTAPGPWTPPAPPPTAEEQFVTLKAQIASLHAADGAFLDLIDRMV